MSDWEEHCPISEDDHPVKRKAWRDGWEYCMAYGPGVPDRDAAEVDRPALLSVWLRGYSAADRVLRQS